MTGRITDCGCPEQFGHRDGCKTLVAMTWPDGQPKIAPVQGYAVGIPWSLQLEAYDVYRARWGGQAALIDLDRRGCRGGFSTGELDGFVPGWRDRVSEIAALRARVTELENMAADQLKEAARPWNSYHGPLPDYDHPLRAVYESGIQYAVELLATILKVDDWEVCDGTEEFDGDLGGTLLNIVSETWATDEHGDWLDQRDAGIRAALGARATVAAKS
jgi:hypothetical protein